MWRIKPFQNHLQEQRNKNELHRIYTMQNERIASIDSVAEEDCVTVKTKYGELSLQIDTGATCNVVPMHTYIALTKDKELRFVEKSNIK